MFWIGNGVNNKENLLPGENDRKILIEAHKGHFELVPVFVKYVLEEIPNLGDVDIDGAGIQAFHVFQPEKKRTDFFSGDG